MTALAFVLVHAEARRRAKAAIDSAPDGYSVMNKSRINAIRVNTLVQYEKKDGKLIKRKYLTILN